MASLEICHGPGAAKSAVTITVVALVSGGVGEKGEAFALLPIGYRSADEVECDDRPVTWHVSPIGGLLRE